MKWSPQQDAALLAVAEWLKAKDKPFFYLGGYAGTGKTTLAKHFAAGIDKVVFAAYTGKAAYVLSQKGCEGASTIHSLIYVPKEHCRVKLAQLNLAIADLAKEISKLEEPEESESNAPQSMDLLRAKLNLDMRELETKRRIERSNLARPMFTLNTDSSIRDAQLVVIDECSMVDTQIGLDLLSFEVPVLVLGDPAQLPPVGNGGYFTAREPDFFLTEIHRQARDSPIIDLATRVRLGDGLLPFGTYGDSRVVPSGSVDSEAALAADQFLVGRNATRHGANRRFRELLAHGGAFPVPGDKLVCLRNNHDLGLLNGSLWTTESCDILDDDRLYMRVADDSGIAVDCEVHTAHFLGTETTDLAWYERKEAQEFDYGYALTVHKSQGSQWSNVLLKDESSCFRGTARRWLYTGITRAADTITVIR